MIRSLMRTYGSNAGTNVTNTGHGDSVIAVSPALARDRIAEGVKKALESDLSAHVLPSAEHYKLKLRFQHHGGTGHANATRTLSLRRYGWCVCHLIGPRIYASQMRTGASSTPVLGSRVRRQW